ncbi:uncharacterized protein LOC116450116 [Corvus moneduloides]|uniref:uncharacterized protein LOC116450116 n=1 Tax=Corvus moneduloides TaxID=1196302 RepID=UPI0013632C55|nr:uncharacterized protein LOC116450116 [Corvus moneduloides]
MARRTHIPGSPRRREGAAALPGWGGCGRGFAGASPPSPAGQRRHLALRRGRCSAFACSRPATRGAGVCFKTGRPGQEVPVSPSRHRRRPAPSLPPSPGLRPGGDIHSPPAGRRLGLAERPRCRAGAAREGPAGQGALAPLSPRGTRQDGGPLGGRCPPYSRVTYPALPCPALHYSTHQAAAPPVPPPAVPAHDWLSPRRRRALRFFHGPADLSLSAGCGGAVAARARWRRSPEAALTGRRAEALRAAGPPPARTSPAGLSTARPGPARPEEEAEVLTIFSWHLTFLKRRCCSMVGAPVAVTWPSVWVLEEGPCCLPAPLGIKFHECLLGRGQLCRA